MKKIIRIASVIALASASLLYVGCTKDFSADLAKTNSEVAAQASKVAALEATVQTINSTVENLKTTKADAAAVNALKEDLESKINTLTSALEQTALLAASAQADADAVAADLEVEKAKLDSIILVVDTLAIESEALRKDVDSLYKNSEELESRIDELEGRVDALSARIADIVAVPSMTPEIRLFSIDTVSADGEGKVDSIIFAATFHVSPAAAVESINEKNVKLSIKEGLTRSQEDCEPFDSTFNVAKVIKNADKGEVTVFVGIAGKAEETVLTTKVPGPVPPAPDPTTEKYEITVKGVKYTFTVTTTYNQDGSVKEVKVDGGHDAAIIKLIQLLKLAFTGETPVIGGSSFYYSLAFCGEDAAKEGYEKVSEYTKTHAGSFADIVTLQNTITVIDKVTKDAITENNRDYRDTISYDKDSTVFATAFNGHCAVVAKLNGEFISLEALADIIGTKASSLAIDTTVRVKPEEETILVSYDDKLYSARTWGPWPDAYNTAPFKAELDWWIAAGMKADGSVNVNGIESKNGVFFKKKGTDFHYFGNRTIVRSEITVGNSNKQKSETVRDFLYIGGKNLGTVNLGTSTEPWYYDFAIDAIKDEFSIKDTTAAKRLDKNLVVENKDGSKFTLSKVSADSVKVSVEKVKYAKVAADTTYKVEWTTEYDLSKKADSTFSAFNWALKVGPRPADPATIKYAVDTVVRGTKSIKATFKTYANSIAAVSELGNRVEFSKPEIKSITINGKALDLTKNKAEKRFSFASVADGEVTFLNAAEGTTVVVATSKCAGITFTYEFTLNLTKGATPTFKALTTFVKEEDGIYSIEIAAPKPVHTHMSGNGAYIEALKTLAFNQYFVVDTTNAALDDLYAVFGTPDTTSTGKFFVNKSDYSKVVDKVKFDDKAFAWNPYDSLTANVVAYLVIPGAAEEYNDTIDQVNIKFWTKDPIKSVAHKDSTVKHNNSKNDVIDLNGLFTVKDYMDSTVIKNGVENIIGSYEYGIEFEYGADSTWTITGGTLSKGTLSLAGSKLTLSAQGAEIVNPVTVEIPFVVKHALDKFGVAAEDRQGTVKVTFTSAK